MRVAPSVSLFAVLLGLSVLPSACKRQSNASLPAGAVVFDGTGVALVPGDGWTQVREQGGTVYREYQSKEIPGELCWPVLEGTNQFAGSLIQTCLDRADRSAPKRIAEKIQQTLQQNPALLKTSWRQEEFRSEPGVPGVHLSFNLKTESPNQKRKWLTRTHIYIVQNKRRQNVSVCYVTVADRDSPAVHQMIRQTLSLK